MPNLVGQVEISFEYHRHLGPRNIAAGVTLRFDSFRPYGFVSEVSWPTNINYDDAIRNAIEGVLQELQGHLEKTEVRLVAIKWDEISASERGFVLASRAATRAAFETK